MPTTIDVQASVEVAATVIQAWAVIANYDLDTQWRKGVQAMNPQPSGLVQVGTTTAEQIRSAGYTMRNDGVVTTVDPDRGFTWRTTSGIHAEGSRRIVAGGKGRCRIELTLCVAPPGLLRLAPSVVRAILRRGLAADALRLGSLIEQERVR